MEEWYEVTAGCRGAPGDALRKKPIDVLALQNLAATPALGKARDATLPGRVHKRRV
jgi:hypothetical protein